MMQVYVVFLNSNGNKDRSSNLLLPFMISDLDKTDIYFKIDSRHHMTNFTQLPHIPDIQLDNLIISRYYNKTGSAETSQD